MEKRKEEKKQIVQKKTTIISNWYFMFNLRSTLLIFDMCY